eukprot:7426999-Alexandrium_andersonii.AAC.1
MLLPAWPAPHSRPLPCAPIRLCRQARNKSQRPGTRLSSPATPRAQLRGPAGVVIRRRGFRHTAR